MKARFLYLFIILTFYSYGQSICSISSLDIQNINSDFKVNSYSGLIDIDTSINSIENSNFEQEIRFYDEGKVPNSIQYLYRIRCVNNYWKGTKYEYIFKVDTYNDTLITDYSLNILKEKELKPKTSWDSFFDSLVKCQFFELPQQKESYIRDFDTIVSEGNTKVVWNEHFIRDGGVCYYQFKIRKKIRTYSYDNPYAYLELYPNDKNLINADRIMQIFQNELIEGK